MTDGEATYPSTPEGRRSTPLDLEASDTGATQHLDLHGNFEPDAFSTDGRSLFLIQYLPAAAPDHYRVMELDLASHRIAHVASPDKVPPSSMQGTRLQQVWAPDRSVLYTLYTNQVSSGAPLTFVHVLNLEDKWAHCIDLPAAFGASRPNAKAMVGSPNGTHLYVTDADAQQIATIDTRRFKVDTTTAAVAAPSRSDRPRLRVAHSRRHLAGEWWEPGCGVRYRLHDRGTDVGIRPSDRRPASERSTARSCMRRPRIRSTPSTPGRGRSSQPSRCPAHERCSRSRERRSPRYARTNAHADARGDLDARRTTTEHAWA